MTVKAKARREAAVRGQRERRQPTALLDSETDPFLPCKGNYGNTLGWSRGSQRLSCVSGDFLIFMLHKDMSWRGECHCRKLKWWRMKGHRLTALSLMRFGGGGMLFALYLLSLLLVRNYWRKSITNVSTITIDYITYMVPSMYLSSAHMLWLRASNSLWS